MIKSGAGELALMERIKTLREEVEDLTAQLEQARVDISSLNNATQTLNNTVNVYTPEVHGTRVTTYIKNNWGSWESGVIHIEANIEGPHYCILGYKYDSWGCVMIMSYFLTRPIYLRVENSNWKDPLWL